MPRGHVGKNRNQPVKPLQTIFQEAIAQPCHAAVLRMKYAYFFHMTGATMESSLIDAFEEAPPLSKSSVSKFISSGRIITRVDDYWRYKAFEAYIDAHLSKTQKKDIFGLAAKASLQGVNVKGTDADEILDTLERYAFPDRLKLKPDVVVLERFLEDLGFDKEAIKLMAAEDNAPDVIDIIKDHEHCTTELLAALKKFAIGKLTTIVQSLGVTDSNPANDR